MSGIDSYVKLMLHGDGTNNSTTFTDSSPTPKTVTANGSVKISTAQYKFGTASANFDGVGDYLSIAAHSDWNWGTDPWTIDFWKRWSTVGNNKGIFDNCQSSSYLQFSLSTADSGNKVLKARFFGTQYAGTTIFVADTWYHIAIVRNGTSLKVYVGGTAEVTATILASATWNGSSYPFWIGGYYSTSYCNFPGWIEEFRVSKGIARWTENFTPPTAPYSTEETALIDAMLYLTTRGQKLQSFAAWLRAHDGIELRDLKASLVTWGLTTEDLYVLLAAYYEHMNELPVSLTTHGTRYRDALFNLRAQGKMMSDLFCRMAASKTGLIDFISYLSATNGTILIDFISYLSATDGEVFNDMAFYLRTIKGVPTFKAVTAYRLSSVMSEVS